MSPIEVFSSHIGFGGVDLVFDQGHRDVSYPANWPNRLPFHSQLGVAWDTYAVQATFQAGGIRHRCRIPWHTVLEIHARATGRVVYTRPPYGTVVPLRAARTRRPIVRRKPAPDICHLRVVP